MIDLVFSFLPWVVFTSVGHLASFTGALVLAIAAGLIVFARAKRRGSVHLLDLASIGYFGILLAAVAVIQPTNFDTWIEYTQAGSYAALTVIVFGSILIRRPFTISYAKETTPEAFWDTDLFLKINNDISARWGFAFLIGALSMAIHANSDAFPVVLQAMPYVAMYLAYRYTQQAGGDDATEPGTDAPSTATITD